MRHRGIYALLTLIAVWTALPSLAHAEDGDQDGLVPKLCELGDLKERVANPPPRDPKIEKPDEPYKLSLKGVKAEWVPSKYVATVRLEHPKPFRSITYSANSGRLEAIVNESYGGSRSKYLAQNEDFALLQRVLDNLYLANTGMPDPMQRQVEVFKLVADRMSQQRRDEAEIDFWTKNPQFLLKFIPLNKSGYHEFTIFADTPEQAQRRSIALLTLLDQGYSRPLQLGLLEQLPRRCEQLHEAQKEVDTRTAEVQRLAEENQKYGRVSSGMLDQLRLQEMQFEIEQAGHDARVARLEKLLQAEGGEERKKSLSDSLTAAEVDQASIRARREKTGELMKKVKDGLQAEKVYQRARFPQQQATENLARIATDIAQIREEIRWFAPLSLVDDTIIVQELEWTP